MVELPVLNYLAKMNILQHGTYIQESLQSVTNTSQAYLSQKINRERERQSGTERDTHTNIVHT